MYLDEARPTSAGMVKQTAVNPDFDTSKPLAPDNQPTLMVWTRQAASISVQVSEQAPTYISSIVLSNKFMAQITDATLFINDFAGVESLGHDASIAIDASDPRVPKVSISQTIKAAIAGAAQNISIPAGSEFDVLNSELYTYSDGQTLTIAQNFLFFDFDDWCEYASYDPSINTVYRTLIQWEYDEETKLYHLNLYKAYASQPITLATYDGENTTWVQPEGVIDLGYKLGFRIGGKVSGDWMESVIAQGTSEKIISLDTIYGIIKSTNNSTNDSINELYKLSEANTEKLAGIDSGAQVNVQSNWTQTDTTNDDYIKNKPSNLVQDDSYTHTDNNYTTAEKTKLAGLESPKYKGAYDSLSQLQAAYPTATTGDTADVNVDGVIHQYVWDVLTTAWVDNGISGADSATGIKSKYESNEDTNAFTDDEKTKLAAIASGAQVNVQSDWSQTTDTADDYIKNKPIVPTKTSQLTNDSNFVADSTYTHTDNNYTTTEKNKLSSLEVISRTYVDISPAEGVTTVAMNLTTNPAGRFKAIISDDTTFTNNSSNGNFWTLDLIIETDKVATFSNVTLYGGDSLVADGASVNTIVFKNNAVTIEGFVLDKS
jgi:hypothetical protein